MSENKERLKDIINFLEYYTRGFKDRDEFKADFLALTLKEHLRQKNPSESLKAKLEELESNLKNYESENLNKQENKELIIKDDLDLIAELYPNIPTQLSELKEAYKSIETKEPLSEFGENFKEYYHKGKEAIEKLLQEKRGQVVGAFYKEGLGDIDLVWGEAKKNNKGEIVGYGLSKIVEKHKEDFNGFSGKNDLEKIANGLNEIIEKGKVTIGQNRAFIQKDNFKSVVALDYNGVAKTWIITAYEKKVSIDTANPHHNNFATNDFSTSSKVDTSLNPTPIPLKSQVEKMELKDISKITELNKFYPNAKKIVFTLESSIKLSDVDNRSFVQDLKKLKEGLEFLSTLENKQEIEAISKEYKEGKQNNFLEYASEYFFLVGQAKHTAEKFDKKTKILDNKAREAFVEIASDTSKAGDNEVGLKRETTLSGKDELSNLANENLKSNEATAKNQEEANTLNKELNNQC